MEVTLVSNVFSLSKASILPSDPNYVGLRVQESLTEDKTGSAWVEKFACEDELLGLKPTFLLF